MLKKILEYFGYKLIKFTEFDELKNECKRLEKKLDKCTQDYEDLFDFKSFKPEHTFEEFCEINNLDGKRARSEVWSKYWTAEYRANEIAFALRNISRHPELLQCFLVEFAKFDWAKIHKFMKDTNWCYSGHKETPTIEELQYTTITLIPEDNFNSSENTISSGGFEVTLCYIDDKPFCKIHFKESDIQYLRG